MAWSHVQSKGATSSSGPASLSAVLGTVPTTGHKIVAGTACSTGATTTTTCKDGNGVSLTNLGGSQISTNTDGEIFAYDVPASATATITASFTSSGQVGIVAQEISGLIAGNTTAMRDGTAGTKQDTAGTSPVGTTGYASTASNEYLVTLLTDNASGASGTQPSGYTLDTNSENPGSGSTICALAYTNSTGTTESDSWSFSGGAGEELVVVTLAIKLPAAGGTFIAPCATIVGQGEGMTPSANTGVASAPTIYQASRRAAFY